MSYFQGGRIMREVYRWPTSLDERHGHMGLVKKTSVGILEMVGVSFY